MAGYESRPGRAGVRDLIGEHKQLCREAEMIRADSIRIRMLAAHAFCSVAEARFKWGSPQHARSTLDIVRTRVAELEFHLREPGHVSAMYADELWRRLNQLKERVEKIEESMKVARLRSRGV
jgi:hypothetical protein